MPAIRAPKRRSENSPPLGVYCGATAHTKCKLTGARCGCTCHAPAKPKQKTRRYDGKVAPWAVYNAAGQRVCPDCQRPLIKKDPKGRGRYPKKCAVCR